MDETFVRIAGKGMYLFRAVDSQGQTVDFLFIGNEGSRSCQDLHETGSGEPGQSPAVRVGQRRSPELSSCDSGTAGVTVICAAPADNVRGGTVTTASNPITGM